MPDSELRNRFWRPREASGRMGVAKIELPELWAGVSPVTDAIHATVHAQNYGGSSGPGARSCCARIPPRDLGAPWFEAASSTNMA
jgi:hypothetical protein